MANERLVKEALLSIVDGIDAGTSTFDNDESMQIVEFANALTNTENKLSKYQACKYLHKSRAAFDNLVREGKLPKGKKEQGFKELFWTLSDLKIYKTRKPEQ